MGDRRQHRGAGKPEGTGTMEEVRQSHRLLLQISAWPSTAQGGPLLRGEASDSHLLLAITKGTAILKVKLHQVDFLKQIVRHLLAGLVQFGTDVDATLPPECQAHKCTSLRAKCLVLLERHFLH